MHKAFIFRRREASDVSFLWECSWAFQNWRVLGATNLINMVQYWGTSFQLEVHKRHIFLELTCFHGMRIAVIAIQVICNSQYGATTMGITRILWAMSLQQESSSKNSFQTCCCRCPLMSRVTKRTAAKKNGSWQCSAFCTICLRFCDENRYTKQSAERQLLEVTPEIWCWKAAETTQRNWTFMAQSKVTHVWTFGLG